MAIYQPVWAFPDARNGLGQGTVDATQGFTASWHISGASAMTAFQIELFANDEQSTSLFTTGRITDGCPAYGTSPQGDTLFFSYNISASALAAAGITNGNEYKMVITQWWSANDSVTQSSASAFITRQAPTLSIASIGTVTSRFYTFTGNYAQAQGDTLNWFQWQIAVAGQEDTPFYDTQKVYGTMQISAFYDGFFAGTNYSVKLTVQTENGVEATTGWVQFPVRYAESAISGYLNATCIPNTSATKIEWDAIGKIAGAATGSYSFEDGALVLPQGSSVLWDNVSGNAMSFAASWGVIWSGKIVRGTGTLLTIGQSGGNITVQYDETSGTLSLKKGSTTIASQTGIIKRPTLVLILTASKFYIRADYWDGGLYPSDTLYPTATLYPAADDNNVINTYELNASYTQQPITSVALSGALVSDYLEITDGDVSQDVITSAITDGDYEPSLGVGDYFKAIFNGNLDADNMTVNGESIVGFALYRRNETSSVLTHIADMETDVTSIYDYSVLNGQGPYTYYLFLAGETTYADPLVASTVFPTVWDWCLLECESTNNKSVYNVLSEYRFGKNLSSGAMSNNNKPAILNNFTQYPTVQLAPQNYKSGSLTSLIGYIEYDNGVEYDDTISLAERLYALSMTANPLFLKDRKGRLMRVRISDSISMETDDNTKQQAQTITLNWVETGSADGVSLVAYDVVQ